MPDREHEPRSILAEAGDFQILDYRATVTENVVVFSFLFHANTKTPPTPEELKPGKFMDATGSWDVLSDKGWLTRIEGREKAAVPLTQERELIKEGPNRYKLIITLTRKKEAIVSKDKQPTQENTAEQHLDRVFPGWSDYITLLVRGAEVPRSNLRGLPEEGGEIELPAGTTGYYSLLESHSSAQGPLSGLFILKQPIKITIGPRGNRIATFGKFHFGVVALPRTATPKE